MKHTKYFETMMDVLQTKNINEKGIEFTEAAFTELYEQSKGFIHLNEEFIDGSMDTFRQVYNDGVKKATVKGTIIGVVGTGIGIGVLKIGKKINKKRKLEKVEEEEV